MADVVTLITERTHRLIDKAVEEDKKAAANIGLIMAWRLAAQELTSLCSEVLDAAERVNAALVVEAASETVVKKGRKVKNA